MSPTMRAAFLGMALLAPLAVSSQEAQTAEKPDVKPGDRWVYRQMDYWTNQVTSVVTREVVNVTRDVIQLVSKGGDGKEFDEVHTAHWNIVVLRNAVYEPHDGMLQFPLQVGKTYPVAYEVAFGPTRSFRARVERTARVVGWEDVEVPAGKFRALKIELDGSYQRLDTAAAGKARNVIWYSPVVKRWVKRTYEDSSPMTGPFYGVRFDLQTFEPVEIARKRKP